MLGVVRSCFLVCGKPDVRPTPRAHSQSTLLHSPCARVHARSILQVEKATVNGSHTTQVLQHLLNVFIDKFVLCPKCHLPETALVVKKGLIQHKCSACGAKEPVDMSHKLCTFILKEVRRRRPAVNPHRLARGLVRSAA